MTEQGAKEKAQLLVARRVVAHAQLGRRHATARKPPANSTPRALRARSAAHDACYSRLRCLWRASTPPQAAGPAKASHLGCSGGCVRGGVRVRVVRARWCAVVVVGRRGVWRTPANTAC